MAANNSDGFADGSVYSRPSLFDGTNYSLWKGRIQEFLMAIDVELWFVVKIKISKEKRRALSMYAKAKNILTCTLTRQEYKRVCNCDTPKQMRDMLQITHKGTKQICEKRVALFVHQYEMLQMLLGKDIRQTYARFMDDLSHPTRSLYSTKVESLIPKKTRTSPLILDMIPNQKTRDELDEDEFDEELAMITKIIQRLSKYRSRNQKNKSNKKESASKSQKIITVRCYECEESDTSNQNV
ncbi:hypothetical protein CDL12_22082 [Handroanthus impetiginosus]|uniref:DUF4219 domain-containing protein n=1 Tax=Handroanthus impetiginosus TaxID=429701 RepID=A0A2G9GJA7_9LAMI|nr:hypothetical protein CDL12_22082 [Handroanthus impetiginosus]